MKLFLFLLAGLLLAVSVLAETEATPAIDRDIPAGLAKRDKNWEAECNQKHGVYWQSQNYCCFLNKKERKTTCFRPKPGKRGVDFDESSYEEVPMDQVYQEAEMVKRDASSDASEFEKDCKRRHGVYLGSRKLCCFIDVKKGTTKCYRNAMSNPPSINGLEVSDMPADQALAKVEKRENEVTPNASEFEKDCKRRHGVYLGSRKLCCYIDVKKGTTKCYRNAMSNPPSINAEASEVEDSNQDLEISNGLTRRGDEPWFERWCRVMKGIYHKETNDCCFPQPNGIHCYRITGKSVKGSGQDVDIMSSFGRGGDETWFEKWCKARKGAYQKGECCFANYCYHFMIHPSAKNLRRDAELNVFADSIQNERDQTWMDNFCLAHQGTIKVDGDKRSCCIEGECFAYGKPTPIEEEDEEEEDEQEEYEDVDESSE